MLIPSKVPQPAKFSKTMPLNNIPHMILYLSIFEDKLILVFKWEIVDHYIHFASDDSYHLSLFFFYPTFFYKQWYIIELEVQGYFNPITKRKKITSSKEKESNLN